MVMEIPKTRGDMHEAYRFDSTGSQRRKKGDVEFALLHSTSSWGGQRDWRRRYIPYSRSTLGSGSCRKKNPPRAFTINGARLHVMWDGGIESTLAWGGVPSSIGKQRDRGLRECGTLDQMW